MSDELVYIDGTDWKVPMWIYERYNRVAVMLNMPVGRLFEAALLMGIFKVYDGMTDVELDAHMGQ